MKTLLNLLLKRRYPKRRSPLAKSTSGFTMIELLVATIIATIIIVPMLAFVVDILNRDVREQAKTNSEQDLQAAVDYIAQDMSQALYVYDEAGVTAIANQLPVDTTKTPILVFWKREFVVNAIDPSNNACPNATTACNDTFVLSLVAYYLIEDNNSTWCQPSGGDCPKRIGRFQIRDGVKVGSNYVCRDNNDDNDGRSSDCQSDSYQSAFQRDLGYSAYNNTDPTTWTKKPDEDYEEDVKVLVNYIEDFTLDSVNNNKLAKITIQGNGLRRIQTNTDCTNSPTYCPEATAQVGGRSGFGQ